MTNQTEQEVAPEQVETEVQGPDSSLTIVIGEQTSYTPEENNRAVFLTAPETLTPENVVEALETTGLTPSDLRARANLFVEDNPQNTIFALAVYAALCGMANRRLDVQVGQDVLNLPEFDRVIRTAPDQGREEGLVHTHLQIGGQTRENIPHLKLEDKLTPQVVSQVRFARWVLFVPPSSPALALSQLVAIGAMRNRAGLDRLPIVVDGTETIDNVTEAPAELCLHTLRRLAEELRRARRGDNREALADFVEPSPRMSRLVQASKEDFRSILTRLGSVSAMVPARLNVPEGEEIELVEAWRCPRPENHTNGDASPSSRVLASADGYETYRCFRCLPEKVDALKLVMWARDCSADEAADWILRK